VLERENEEILNERRKIAMAEDGVANGEADLNLAERDLHFMPAGYP